MKKPPIALLNTFKLFLLILFILTISCTKQEQKATDAYFNTNKTIAEPTLDFNSIDALNRSNKKVIDLAAMAFNQNHSNKNLLLLLKIKKDHQKIDADLKKLTEKNLIIIPKPIYDLNIYHNISDHKNPKSFLLKELENQISILNKTKKTAKNFDYKIFIIKSKKIAQRNYDALRSY